MAELPDFVAARVAEWDRLAALKEKQVDADAAPEIKITLPDGKVVQGKAGVTSSFDVAAGISATLAQKMLGGKVTFADGSDKLLDLHAPIEADCRLELVNFQHPMGAKLFWHSSAHVLGQAIELYMKDAKLCIGPPIDDGGFYYDVHLPGKQVFHPADLVKIQELVQKIQKEKQKFSRMVLEKSEALKMFSDNKFKISIINSKVPDGETCTAYRCGPLIDLCRGPHVPSTGSIKTFMVLKSSSAYWLGDAKNASLQRVYGISFPDKKLMKEYKVMIAEAEKRDHRKLGKDQKLFFFNEISPGSAFFLPHGARIYNKLIELIRGEYKKRGYDEVVTPNVYNVNLWKTSGHWQNYKDNMFHFECENQEFGVKPMNCPGHCILFKHAAKSYRELPMRVADFGVLHRNELSGALTGLTRVRRFQQDDAHIFCRPDQIQTEILGVLDMLKTVYGVLGFTFQLQLSTRPDKYLGAIDTWDKAELALAEALNAFGHEWSINPADGAFYGPKIDIQLLDALKRKHQCATVQLDFQLPRRFELEYAAQSSDTDAKQGAMERPVMIHRAILGSVERMIAVLLEHTAGKWPFWLSPRQVIVVPVSPEVIDYAEEIAKELHDAGYYADADSSNKQLKKKIREAQLAQYNFILVVGAKERETRSVNIRFRDHPNRQEAFTLDAAKAYFAKLTAEKTRFIE